jgi:nucleoporin NUP159
VISSENEGGLAVFAVDDLLQQKKEPGQQISTASNPVRAMLPNPSPELSQYMVVILDSGRMDLIDITTGTSITVRDEGVTCAAWSTKGKAFVAGFADGTATTYMSATREERGRIPQPKGLGEGYTSRFRSCP